MKFEHAEDLTDDRVGGFVKITDLGNAQQATFDILRIKALLKIMETLEKLGFSSVVITVENGYPIVVGGKCNGIAISSQLDE